MRLITTFLLLLLNTTSMAATVNIWRDETCAIFYGDAEVSKKMAHVGNAITYAKPKAKKSAKATTATQEKKQPKVVMYSASWCGYCRKAREYFKKNGVAFTEYDVEKNPIGLAFYSSQSRKAVPIIMVDGEKHVGYSKRTLDKLLKTN